MVTTRRRSCRITGYRLLWLSRVACAVGVILLLSACSVTSPNYPFQMPGIDPASPPGAVWPAPPETPRYAFIGHLYGESNTVEIDPNRGALARFFAAVVGLDAEKKTLLDMIQPQQICSDGNGRIYVADAGRQSIFVFDENIGEFFIWNETSLNIPFLSPVGVIHALDSVWVTDSELALAYQLNYEGEVINTLGKGVLNRPTGITYDPVGARLFISDTDDSNIKVFDAGGELIDVWGNSGAGDGELNHPTFIVYRKDKLYVVDSLNARIQIFDGLGRFVKTLGHRGLYIGNLSRPKGIALDSDGNIYVAESYYDHVIIYNAEGRLLMSLGGPGLNPGQFSQPTGLWVDEKDRIYVSDMLNRRVSMFQYLGSN